MGVFSAIIGILVVIGFLTLSIMSGLLRGEGGFLFGVLGLGFFALSILGFLLSYKALKQKDIFYRFPIMGVVFNGIMMIVYLTLYLMGI